MNTRTKKKGKADMDYRILLIAPLAALVLSVSAAAPQLSIPWQSLSMAVPVESTNAQAVYEIGLDPQAEPLGARSLTIHAVAPLADAARSMAAAHQQAFGYGGHRVRFSGQLRTQGVHGWAGLYLGEGRGEQLNHLFGGMPDADKHLPMASALPSGDGWHDVSVVVDVPPGALAIDLGLALIGDGQVWARGLRFDEVGAQVAPTISPIPYDWAHARQAVADGRKMMASSPPKPLVNAALD